MAKCCIDRDQRRLYAISHEDIKIRVLILRDATIRPLRGLNCRDEAAGMMHHDFRHA